MFKIIKETEKAVAVQNDEYLEAQKTMEYDLKELNGRQIGILKNQSSLIWLPKSQIQIEDGFVTSIPSWLAKKYGLITVVKINGRSFAKEFLIDNKKMLNELGITAEQLAQM